MPTVHASVYGVNNYFQTEFPFICPRATINSRYKRARAKADSQPRVRVHLMILKEVPEMLATILIVFAFVCEVLAAVGVPSPPRFNLMAAGLAFYFLSLLLSGVHIG